MTIKKIGTVTITEDTVLVEHFHFVGGDKFGSAAIDVIEWAQDRLTDALVEERESLVRRQKYTGVKE